MEDYFVLVSSLISVDTVFQVCSSKALINSVLVNSPHVVDSLVNAFLVAVLADEGWGNCPQQHVMSFEFEESYCN